MEIQCGCEAHVWWESVSQLGIKITSKPECKSMMSYRVHYRGILSSSSPAEISAWGSSASETTSGPGTDTASAKTLISVQAKTQSSRIINQTMACSSSWVHKHVTLIAYFDKIFYFKRQLPADVENVHTFSKDFYFSCRHALLTQKREMRDERWLSTLCKKRLGENI